MSYAEPPTRREPSLETATFDATDDEYGENQTDREKAAATSCLVTAVRRDCPGDNAGSTGTTVQRRGWHAGQLSESDHDLRQVHGACAADVLWIEEMSQIETSLWTQFNKPESIQWLLNGDFNQFPAIFDSWHGASVHEEAFRRSSFFHYLAGGNRLTLTEGHRSDMALFDFYSSLIAGGERFSQPLAEVLQAARALTGFGGPARHNLCISHRRRILLNRQLNKAFLPDGVAPTFVRAKPKKGQMCAAQSLFIWPGIELLGCVQATRKGIRNNVLYQVLAIGEGTATLAPAEGEGNPIELTLPQVGEWLRLSFSRTYASIQGTEFGESLRLHDTTNPHFSMRHLFVALSRGRECGKISIF